MSDGLKLIAASIAANNPGPLLRMPENVWVEGPETRALAYVKVHYAQFRQLPSGVAVQENTGIRLPTIRDGIDYYMTCVVHRHAHNQAREHYPELRRAMEDTSPEGIRAIHAAASAILRAVQNVDTRGSQVLTMGDIWTQYEARMNKAIAAGDGYHGIPIGYPAMDKETLGLQESDMVSLLARTGMGKTIILCKQADTAIQLGRRVLFVTTEMSALQIGIRMACLTGQFNPEFLKIARLSTTVRRMVSSFMNNERLQELLHIQEAGFSSSTGEIEARVAEIRPDLILVDGAYLLRPASWTKNMSRFDRVTNASDEMKSISLVYKTPLLASYQFNRGAGKGGADGDLEHVALSDAIVNNSSIVFSLAPGPTDDPGMSRRLRSLKGRDGEEFDFPINWRFRPNMDISQYQEEDRYGPLRQDRGEAEDGEEGEEREQNAAPEEEGLGV